MEALILAAVAASVAQRSYSVISALHSSLSKPVGPIIIEVTSEDGKTYSKETISVKTSRSISLTVSSLLDRLVYHLHTIYLFTCSDAKTAMVPWMLFGAGNAVCAPLFGLRPLSSTFAILSRLPITMAWVWLILLPFCIGNQSEATAIIEDAANKAWRPMPAKRISVTNAGYLQIAAHTAAFCFSLRYGGVSQCLLAIVLGYLYNSCGGANNSWVSRHLLNALAFITFGSGAMEVSFGRTVAYTPMLVSWLRIIALVVFTGIQTADLYDQQGDAAVNRKTLPLVYGDEAARYMLAISVLSWSLFCPAFWELSFIGYIVPVLSGLVVVNRTFTLRDAASDKTTYKLWNLWLVSVYCLPVMKLIGA